MKRNIFFVDSFTATPFKGNPTSVCVTDRLPAVSEMQAIASELNLPVTAFISPAKKSGHFDIRYFTPVTEIPACGHATLASSKIAMMQEKTVTITFITRQGLNLKAVAQQDYILMRYPRFEWQKSNPEKETLDSLGIFSFLAAAYSPELETLFIEMDSADELRKIQPDYLRMKKSSDIIKEVVITCASDEAEFDYLLRSFCPWIGIDEDPVTGSVHSVLGSYWQHELKKNVLRAYQASQRGGEILINAFDDRIEIGGQSVIIMRGEMDC